jgi:cation transport ATPase
LGFSYAQERLLFLGTSISDVPAMRVSSISAAVRSQLQDDYTESAAEIILPDNKLVTIEKLINWSYFYC